MALASVVARPEVNRREAADASCEAEAASSIALAYTGHGLDLVGDEFDVRSM